MGNFYIFWFEIISVCLTDARRIEGFHLFQLNVWIVAEIDGEPLGERTAQRMSSQCQVYTSHFFEPVIISTVLTAHNYLYFNDLQL